MTAHSRIVSHQIFSVSRDPVFFGRDRLYFGPPAFAGALERYVMNPAGNYGPAVFGNSLAIPGFMFLDFKLVIGLKLSKLSVV